mmetsp:Transcript_51280/g.171137  ORF Transcript_51280/g.171137 Transcript_51280/m.171137 type:complete len:396 (+) Transcript_51280:220-1407(+)
MPRVVRHSAERGGDGGCANALRLEQRQAEPFALRWHQQDVRRCQHLPRSTPVQHPVFHCEGACGQPRGPQQPRQADCGVRGVLLRQHVALSSEDVRGRHHFEKEVRPRHRLSQRLECQHRNIQRLSVHRVVVATVDQRHKRGRRHAVLATQRRAERVDSAELLPVEGLVQPWRRLRHMRNGADPFAGRVKLTARCGRRLSEHLLCRRRQCSDGVEGGQRAPLRRDKRVKVRREPKDGEGPGAIHVAEHQVRVEQEDHSVDGVSSGRRIDGRDKDAVAAAPVRLGKRHVDEPEPRRAGVGGGGRRALRWQSAVAARCEQRRLGESVDSVRVGKHSGPKRRVPHHGVTEVDEGGAERRELALVGAKAPRPSGSDEEHPQFAFAARGGRSGVRDTASR